MQVNSGYSLFLDFLFDFGLFQSFLPHGIFFTLLLLQLKKCHKMQPATQTGAILEFLFNWKYTFVFLFVVKINICAEKNLSKTFWLIGNWMKIWCFLNKGDSFQPQKLLNMFLIPLRQNLDVIRNDFGPEIIIF